MPYKPVFQPGLVFYDLEWTGPELLQIGAVTSERSFMRTVLTDVDIHYKVAEKIKLETRYHGAGDERQREVYDCQIGKFMPTVSLKSALEDFLDWIKTIIEKTV